MFNRLLCEALEVTLEGSKKCGIQARGPDTPSPISDDSTPNIKQGRNSVRSCNVLQCKRVVYIQTQRMSCFYIIHKTFLKSMQFLLKVYQASVYFRKEYL